MRRPAALGHPDFGQLYPCACLESQNRNQLRSRLQRYSNLGALTDVTFSGLRQRAPAEDDGRRLLWQRAMEAAEEYAEAPEGWLALSGPSGSGKTALAAAIANACVQRGQPAFFIDTPDLLDHLRSAYAPDSPMSYDQLFEQVRSSPLLVLDDLGAQSATPWAQEKLFQVLNHRFNGRLPTVITLQCPVEDLDPALRTRLQTQPFSRLYELGPPDGEETPLLQSIGGLGDQMLADMTFENFDCVGSVRATAGQRQSLEDAYKASQKYASHPEGWLALAGDIGCGKTHLSVAVINERLKEGQRCFFAFVPALLDHLRTAYNPDSPVRYDQLFDRIKDAPLLVLDDLGSEATTPWAEEKLFQIIAYRHNTRLPTVINTDRRIEDLESARPRIASRLKDSRTVWANIAAPDYRDGKRHGKPPEGRSTSRAAPRSPRRGSP